MTNYIYHEIKYENVIGRQQLYSFYPSFELSNNNKYIWDLPCGQLE